MVVAMQRHSSPESVLNSRPVQKLPKLLTSKLVSEMLSIPEGTLRYWRKVGIGPKWLKLEGSIRYDLADVLAYIDRGRRTPSVRANMEEMRVIVRDTGMRNISEVCGIRIEHIDWHNRVIFNPKGKTPEARRSVPM